MERRGFLKAVIKIGFIFLGILSLPFLVSLKSFKVKAKETRFFYLARVEEMPERNVKKFNVDLSSHILNGESNSSGEGSRGIAQRAVRIYVVKTSDDWIALSPVCTHLGCLVNYNRTKNEFICPCHGGRYSMDGKVLGGPPPQPLTRLPLKIEKEYVFVGLKV